MNLQTAVAASLLPASRSRVAAVCKELRDEPSDGLAFLELVRDLSGSLAPLAASSLLQSWDEAGMAMEAGRRAGLEPVALTDPRYPAWLAAIVDPPPVLWVQGRSAVLGMPAVAVIGSRAATPYALEVAHRIAGELAGCGILVVSGLARGVDSAAHRGCLDAGGATVAVQGCGLDRVYPSEHAALAARIAESGLVVSELAPGVPPLPGHFPLRNRIISGMSRATVVVEASEHSGSLITARCALEQGRDVMAVPGSVLSGRNRGSHALLKDGARIVESADDILQELGLSSAVGTPAASAGEDGDAILSGMAPGEPYELDDLAALTGLEGTALLARLTELELAGLIAGGGGRFVRRMPGRPA